MRASIELHRICSCYIALYSGDLSLVAINIMEASIVLYSIIITTIAKSVFPDVYTHFYPHPVPPMIPEPSVEVLHSSFLI